MYYGLRCAPRWRPFAESRERPGSASRPSPGAEVSSRLMDRYAEIHGAFRWNVPASFNIAQACCSRWARDRARFALYWEDESGATAAYSFWDLERDARRL